MFQVKLRTWAIDGIRMTYETDSNNSAPIASDDGNIVNEGGTTIGNFLTNDTDPDRRYFTVCWLSKGT